MTLAGMILLVLLGVWNAVNVIKIHALERQLGMLLHMKAGGRANS